MSAFVTGTTAFAVPGSRLSFGTVSRSELRPRKVRVVAKGVENEGSGKLTRPPMRTMRRTRWQVAELLNARLAMVGVTVGTAVELTQHMNYIEQVKQTYPVLIALVLLVGYGVFRTKDVEVDTEKPFLESSELLNGRAAMMGVLCKLLYDGSNLLV